MIGALLLSATLFAPAPDHASAVRIFAEALEREDLSVVEDPGQEFREGLADMIATYDQIEVASARIVSSEATEKGVRLLVDLDAKAVTPGRRRPATLPRWWYVTLREEGGWRIVSTTTLEQSLAASKALAPPEELERALSREDVDPQRFLILLAMAAGDPGEAGRPTLSWALGASRASRLPKAEAVVLQTLSFVELVSGKHAESIAAAEQSLAIAESLNDTAAVIDAYFSLGIAYWFTNDHDRAVATLRSTGPLAAKVDDPRIAQRAVYMASTIELRRMRLREALAIARELHELAGRYPNLRAQMDAISLLGLLHAAIGDEPVAHRYYTTALDIARALTDTRSEAFLLHNTAMMTEDRDEKRRLLREALALGTKILPSGELAGIQLAYASMQRNDHDLEGAEQTLAALIANATAGDERAILASALAFRADLHITRGEIDAALRDTARARAVYQDKEGGTRVKTYTHLSEILAVEGRALRAAGRRSEAEEVWRNAIDVAETEIAEVTPGERAADAMDAKFPAYPELLDLFVEQGCAREALILAERMRARSLREALRYGRVDLSAGLDAETRAREEALEKRLAEANRAMLIEPDPATAAARTRERDETRLALRRFRNQLYLANAELRNRQPESFDDYETWQPQLEPGELIVATAVTENATFVFALEHDPQAPRIDVRVIPIKAAELESRVNALVATLEHRNYDYRDQATGLYELLLRHLAPRIAAARNVRIVPDGVLWRLPFHVLVDRSGKHLAERVAVSYSPSLARHEPKRDPAARRTLLAFGNPQLGAGTESATRTFYRDVSLGPLPDAVNEVRSIARLYPGAEIRTGAAASEVSFKQDAASFDVLHLATHSIVDDRAPMFSSIVLASGEDRREDGLLEAREIVDLKLSARIAVLSACETARGRITPGEGIIGLSWAMLVAGVPKTVVSQWKVGSASTASLMASFHQRLNTGAEPAVALREAMLRLRRKPQWRHPFYWAPFVLVEYGD